MHAAVREQECRREKISFEVFTGLNKISGQNPEVSVLGAVEFDFPIRRSNNGLVGECIRLAAIRALLAAHRTCFVRGSVNVDDA